MVNHCPSLVRTVVTLLLLTGAMSIGAEPLRLDDNFYTNLEFADADRAAAQRYLEGVLRERRFAEARDLSEQLWKGLFDGAAESELTMAKVQANHGMLLALTRDLTGAQEALAASRERFSARYGPFHRDLFPLLYAKGVVDQLLEDDESAEESFRAAQHVVHRHEGVYTPSQLPVVGHLTAINLRNGNYDQADREQRFDLRINEQTHGPDSTAILDTLSRLGNYFADRGVMVPMTQRYLPDGRDARQFRDDLFSNALEYYNRGIGIIEAAYGVNDMRLVPFLEGIAATRVKQGFNRRRGEAALERAVEIVRINPGTDVEDLAEATVALADLYIITSDPRARPTYKAAWDLLEAKGEDYAPLRYELFGTPKRLWPDRRTQLYLNRPPDAWLAGATELYANAEYSVRHDGRVAGVKILDGNVPNENQRMLKNILLGTRYRPRMENGEFVATDGLTYHQRYAVRKRTPSSTSFSVNQGVRTNR